MDMVPGLLFFFFTPNLFLVLGPQGLEHLCVGSKFTMEFYLPVVAFPNQGFFLASVDIREMYLYIPICKRASMCLCAFQLGTCIASLWHFPIGPTSALGYLA